MGIPDYRISANFKCSQSNVGNYFHSLLLFRWVFICFFGTTNYKLQTTMFSVMLFFLVQVINTRCEAIEKLSAVAYEEEKKMFFLLRTMLKFLYFFVLFSFWCLLLTLGFGEYDVQWRLRMAAERVCKQPTPKRVSLTWFEELSL